MTSLYYLPKNNYIDVKKYLSGGNIQPEKGHFPINGVEDTKVFVDNGAFSITLKGGKLPSPKDLAATFSRRVVGADIIAAGPDVPINLKDMPVDEKIKRAQLTVQNMREFISTYNGNARALYWTGFRASERASTIFFTTYIRILARQNVSGLISGRSGAEYH